MWINRKDFDSLTKTVNSLRFDVRELRYCRERDLVQFKKLMDYLDIEQATQPTVPDVFVKRNAN